MLRLHTLKPRKGSKKQARRVGRGNASRGTYSGRGIKGQRARSGGRQGAIRRSLKALLERVPKKRGFLSIHQKPRMVNLEDIEKHFSPGSVITPSVLKERGLIDTTQFGVKVLARGKVSQSFTVQAHAFSKQAKQSLDASGGKAVMIIPPLPGKKRGTAPKEKQSHA